MAESKLMSCPHPETINPLQVYGFELRIEKIPNITFWVKDANIPDITLSEARQATPFVDIPHVGDKTEWGSLDIRYMIDEWMDNYESLYEWITLIGFVKTHRDISKWKRKFFNADFNQYDADLALCSSATLTVKGANNTPVRTFHFPYMWISNLGAISLTDENQETQYMYGTAIFKFPYFELSDSHKPIPLSNGTIECK